ncbi:hypothetical protein ACQCU1_13235 [Sutcliffiella horikoshii]|nr:hypothetical protein [Sutcliffiella horikoshii]
MDILHLQWIYDFYDGYIVFTMDISPLTMDKSNQLVTNRTYPTTVSPAL